jgi:serine protease Do
MKGSEMSNEKPGRTQRRVMAALFGTTLLCAGVAAGFSASGAMVPAPISVPEPPKLPSFANLVTAVKPAVVNISTTQVVKTSKFELPENSPLGDMLQQFLGPEWQKQLQQQSQQPSHALGSGFIIDPAGYIVTNNHVIDDASDIQVTLSDGSTVAARVIGRDSKTDVALLKIPASHPLPYLAFGDSHKAHVGDWVIAVGNPFGLGGTVTAGIISGDNRDINAGPYDNFLQIDAPINPGNSGGPLFDESGQVIGVDTAIYSPTGGSVGIGFAIPSNVVRNVVDQLREHGRVTRGWLGVQMQEITPALAKAIGLSNAKGVLVDLVTKDSPAAHAGIKQGDIITGFNGAPVTDTRDLAFAIAAIPAGKNVSLQVQRDGQQITANVTIGVEHEQHVAANGTPPEHRAHSGLELAPLSSEKRQELGIGTTGGVLVADVMPGSPADQSGLQAGDVILGIGGRPVSSPEDAASRIHAAESGKKPALPLLVMRDGTTAYMALDLKPGSGTG